MMAIDLARLARGIGFALLYAFSLAVILWQSPIYATLPGDIPLPYIHLFPLGPLAALFFVAAFFITMVAVLPKRHEVGAFVIPLTVTLLITGFAFSNIDWTRVIVNLHLTQGGLPPAQSVVLTWVPLSILVLYFENEEAVRLRRHYVAKGIDEAEAQDAARNVRISSLQWILPAVATTLIVFFAFSYSRSGGLQDAVKSLPIGIIFVPLMLAVFVAVLAYVFSQRK